MTIINLREKVAYASLVPRFSFLQQENILFCNYMEEASSIERNQLNRHLSEE